MCSATKKELVEVVKYFRDEFDDLWRKYLEATHSVGLTLMTTGMKFVHLSRTAKR